MFHEFEQALGRIRFAWAFPLCVAACVFLTIFPLTFEDPVGSAIFYVVITIPPVVLLLLLLFYKRRGQQRLTALFVLTAFALFSAMLLMNFHDTRETARWLVCGKIYRDEVLSQPALNSTQLRYVEWEGWGFAGAGNTTVYLVSDPSDSLASAAKSGASGKFGSLPCAVARVRRRGKGWYTVLFYTDTTWEDCTH